VRPADTPERVLIFMDVKNRPPEGPNIHIHQ